MHIGSVYQFRDGYLCRMCHDYSKFCPCHTWQHINGGVYLCVMITSNIVRAFLAARWCTRIIMPPINHSTISHNIISNSWMVNTQTQLCDPLPSCDAQCYFAIIIASGNIAGIGWFGIMHYNSIWYITWIKYWRYNQWWPLLATIRCHKWWPWWLGCQWWCAWRWQWSSSSMLCWLSAHMVWWFYGEMIAADWLSVSDQAATISQSNIQSVPTPFLPFLWCCGMLVGKRHIIHYNKPCITTLQCYRILR